MSVTTLPAGVRILDPTQAEKRIMPPDHSTGGARTLPVSPALGTDETKINAVYLEAGARFRPHSHPFDQILLYVYGTGVVAVDGGEDVIVPEGNYVILPASTVHMHGCTAEGGPALQLSMMRDTQTTFDVVCPEPWKHWQLEDGAA